MRQMAAKWFDHYCDDFAKYEAAADLARREVADALRGSHVAVHSVTCRAKDPESVRHKIEDQDLGRPKRQLKDLIGVRVITTFAEGVDDAARRLESLFPKTTRTDKRDLLEVHRFGYRSVHLQTYIDRVSEVSDAGTLLAASTVEIQVRSVIEHAWAEIEHDLRYKSGVRLPDALARRFSALAGALELVDREFDALHGELLALVRTYSSAYGAEPPAGARLDSARLSGLIAARRPSADSIGPGGLPMALPDAARLVALLEQVNVTTDTELEASLGAASLLEAVRNYADSQSVDPERVSGYAVVALLILSEAKSLGRSLQMFSDPALRDALSP
jgi:ppGpp synthetase/RelA/SpoT-type nucleotidyltranferase